MAAVDFYEETRSLLRGCLAGGGRFTWVREPRSALAVSLWPFSQVLHAYAMSDPVSGPARFPGLARGLSAYRHPKGAYRESVGRGHRYFDDNAWVGLALLQHYSFNGESKWLQKANAVDEFLREGVDIDTGGIRWVEGGDTLNACSTGSAALLHCCLGHPIDAELEFLSDMRNSDGLVQDHIHADGSVEPAIFSYNQGLLISAASRAGKKQLAAEVSDAAAAYFTADRLWDQAVCFNAVYAKAQLASGHRAEIEEYADRLADEARDDQGWFTQAGRYDDGKVLDTAGALQILTLLRFPQLIDKAL